MLYQYIGVTTVLKSHNILFCAMAVIPQRVECSLCYQTVLKSQARVLSPFDNIKRHECFSCFKKKSNLPEKEILLSVEEKRDLFCTFCKFKFRSRRLACPYCGKKEYLMEGELTTTDLLA